MYGSTTKGDVVNRSDCILVYRNTTKGDVVKRSDCLVAFHVETPAYYGFASSSYTVTEGESVELTLEAYELLPSTTTFTLRVVEGNATQGWYVHTLICALCNLFSFYESRDSLYVCTLYPNISAYVRMYCTSVHNTYTLVHL